MALQYDNPVWANEFTEALADNPKISETTSDTISSVLGLDTAASVVVAGWDGVATDITVPADQTPDVLVVGYTGAAGAELNIPEAAANASVIIVDSDVGVSLTVGEEETASAARVSAEAVAGIARVVVGGNGNDVLTVNGSANVLLDGGDGNDTLTTGSGNDIIIAGTGINTIDAGAGNDTIVTGLGVDTIDAGDGNDTIDVQAAQANFTVSVSGSSLVLTGVAGTSSAGNSVSVTNGELVTFSDGNTLAIVGTQEEAQALSLYQAILGRGADATGAEGFRAEIANGAELSDVVNSFLTSAEHYSNLRADWLTDVYSAVLGRATDADGVASWQAQFEAGATRGEVAAGIAGSAEAASLTDEDFVSALYTAALGRSADDAGLDSWVALLTSGEATRAEVADQIYSSAESNAHINSDFLDSLFANTGVDAAAKAGYELALNAGVSQADVVISVLGQLDDGHASNVVVVPGAV